MSSRCKSCTTLTSVIFGLMTCFLCLWMPSAFFAKELETREVHAPFAGLFFSCFALPSVFLGFILGKFSARCGRKKLMLLGLTMALLCTLGLGAVTYIENKDIFIGLSIILRFIQGIGCIMMRIMSTPILAINFPKVLNAIFILFVFIISLSILVAPMWGALFIEAGSEWPYFSLSLLIGLVGYPFFIFGLPKDTHVIRMGEEVE